MRKLPELEDVINDPCSCNSPDRASTHTRGDEGFCLDHVELGAASGIHEYRQALRDTISMVGNLEQERTEKGAA